MCNGLDCLATNYIGLIILTVIIISGYYAIPKLLAKSFTSQITKSELVKTDKIEKEIKQKESLSWLAYLD